MSPDDPSAGPGATRTTFRTCPLCEATCGLEISHRDGVVTRIRGDREDVFSRGFVCPKGASLKSLHEDPDRLRAPWIRDGSEWREATWPEAFEAIAERVGATTGDRIAAIAGDLVDCEAMAALGDLMDALGSPHVDCRQDGARLGAASRAGYLFNTTIQGVEQADACLLVGANPRWEAPIVNARLRERWLRGGFAKLLEERSIAVDSNDRNAGCSRGERVASATAGEVDDHPELGRGLDLRELVTEEVGRRRSLRHGLNGQRADRR